MPTKEAYDNQRRLKGGWTMDNGQWSQMVLSNMVQGSTKIYMVPDGPI